MIADPDTDRSYRVVDVHQHLSLGEGTDPSLPVGPRLEVLDRFGIDQAVLLPPSGAFGGRLATAAEINRMTAAVVADHSDRFPCGVAHVNLAEGEGECLRVLDEAVGTLGLRGAVWHHRFQGASLDHPAMPRLLRRCAELGVPAMVHVISGSSLEDPWRLDALLDEVPEASVIALDPFSSIDRAEAMIGVARRHRGLSCDLGAAISVSGWVMKRYLDAVGPERLLFGTDLYMSPRTWYAPGPLYEVLHLDVEPEVKAMVLGGNALRLFDVDVPAS